MDQLLEHQSGHLGKKEDKANTSHPFRVRMVDEEVIKNFVKTHAGDANEKHWVMYDIRWADDFPLFTFGAATCLVPVFVNRETNQFGLGHLPYLYIDHEKIDLPQTKEELIFEEARKRLLPEGPKWEMFLFGGQPLDGTDESLRLSEANASKLIEMFSSIGVICRDHTTKNPNIGIDGIIVDPTTKEILVCYS